VKKSNNLISEIQNKSADLNTISRIAEIVQNFEDEKKELLFENIFALLGDLIDFTHAALFLLDKDTAHIKLIAQHGQAIDLIEMVEFELGKGFSAWVAKEQKPKIINSLKGNLSFGRNIKSFLSHPFLLQNELVGVINLGHEQENAFNENILPDLHIITSILAGLFYRSNQINHLKKQNDHIQKVNKELKETHDKLIKAEKHSTISALTVSLNHEINNPLMIISGNLQLLLATKMEVKQVQRLQIIEEQINRITEVVRKLREIQEPLLEEYLEGDSDKMLRLDK